MDGQTTVPRPWGRHLDERGCRWDLPVEVLLSLLLLDLQGKAGAKNPLQGQKAGSCPANAGVGGRLGALGLAPHCGPRRLGQCLQRPCTWQASWASECASCGCLLTGRPPAPPALRAQRRLRCRGDSHQPGAPTAGSAKKEMAKTEKQEAMVFPTHVCGTLSP